MPNNETTVLNVEVTVTPAHSREDKDFKRLTLYVDNELKGMIWTGVHANEAYQHAETIQTLVNTVVTKEVFHKAGMKARKIKSKEAEAHN